MLATSIAALALACGLGSAAHAAALGGTWPSRPLRGPLLSPDGTTVYVQSLRPLRLSAKPIAKSKLSGFWFSESKRPGAGRTAYLYAVDLATGGLRGPLAGGIAGLYPQASADGPLVGFDSAQSGGFPDKFESSALVAAAGMRFGFSFLPSALPNWNLHQALLADAESASNGLVVEQTQDPLVSGLELPGYSPGDLIHSAAGSLSLVEPAVCTYPNGGRGAAFWSSRIRPPATLSDDGRFAYFCSTVRDAPTYPTAGINAPNPTTAFESHNIHRKNIATGAVEIVNRGPGGMVITNPRGFLASVSANGERAVFASSRRGAATGARDGAAHLYLRDFATGTTRRIDSFAHKPARAAVGSTNAQISTDGGTIVFQSDLPLSRSDRNRATDIYVFDVLSSRLRRVSGSGRRRCSSFEPTIAGDGKLIVFSTNCGTQSDARRRPVTRLRIVKR